MKSYVIIGLAVALCTVLVFSGCKTGQGTYPLSSSNICGDGKVTGSEMCDTPGVYCDANPQPPCKHLDCASYSNKYSGGRLLCNSKCMYDISSCIRKR